MKMTKAKCGASNPATQASTPKMNMGGMAMKKPMMNMGGMAKKKPMSYGYGGMASKRK
jgi:hypothetical protein